MGFGEPVESGDEARCYQVPGRVFVVEAVGDVQDRYVGERVIRINVGVSDAPTETATKESPSPQDGDVVLRAREDNLVVVVDGGWVKPHH